MFFLLKSNILELIELHVLYVVTCICNIHVSITIVSGPKKSFEIPFLLAYILKSPQ